MVNISPNTIELKFFFSIHLILQAMFMTASYKENILSSWRRDLQENCILRKGMYDREEKEKLTLWGARGKFSRHQICLERKWAALQIEKS